MITKLVINEQSWEGDDAWDKDPETLHELSRVPFQCEVKPEKQSSSSVDAKVAAAQSGGGEFVDISKLVKHLLR